MAQNNLNKNLDLNRYQDSGGITTKRLNLGLWIVSHRRQFILGVIGVLIGVSAIFYGYAIYNYVDYLFFGGKAERLAVEQMATVSPIDEQQRIKNAAQVLVGSVPQVFLNNDKYDFLAKVKNSNTNFFANFNYCFLDGATELACGSTFILPDETKYVTVFATALKYQPLNVELVVKDINWQRLDFHKYPDWKNFAISHLNFVIENAAFKTSDISGLSEKIGLDILEFDINNKTAYNYWEVPVNIILLSGGSPVAINHYVLPEFKSGDKKSVRISWPDSIPKPDQISVIPNLNIADESILMKY
ncbi:hypothetical protein COX68_02630 [Candidatus Falkowbacteria bacterium CG_4_10_14_0_2_um_filter_41_15]|uniref:Uncharacterized protein n=1 Tax=Candidatus Falkowbacteria bacterium CG_4_10_14_0_2_um_filter_41_15 TaxID=1974554 RepID=A0A2M7VY83_9BACT|nr:MAG: hypothetical protein COX68_02630 [Candidatus Falkowbacteria bacterium CG_4_10_14_0_2_um_filter_41_15]